MAWLLRDRFGLNWREDGATDGRPLLFLNSLGTDLRMWDAMVAALPIGIRAIRMDTRGHGLSDVPSGPYSLETLVGDAQAILDHLGIDAVTVAGISLGGMMAKSLALRQPDRIKALILSNTAPKMGTAEMWQTRMDAIRANGLESIADQILERWFADPAKTSTEGPWRNMLCRTPDAGYLGCCGALAAADLTAQVSTITQPALVIAGSQDGASPPHMVKAGADRLPNARYVELAGVGHLPPLECPADFSKLVNGFLEETANV